MERNWQANAPDGDAASASDLEDVVMSETTAATEAGEEHADVESRPQSETAAGGDNGASAAQVTGEAVNVVLEDSGSGERPRIRLLLADSQGQPIGLSRLFGAVMRGETALAHSTLAAEPSRIWERDSAGETLTIYAVRHWHSAGLLQLLAQLEPALLQEQDGGGTAYAFTEPPVYRAAYDGRLEALQLLLDLRPGDIGYRLQGCSWTLLHAAAFSGHTEAVQLLLERGADVRAVNASGRSVLGSAALAGHADIVALLLSRYSWLARRADVAGYLPLHHAAEHGHMRIVRLVLESAPDTASGRTPAGWTPVHLAALGKPEALRELLAVDSGLARARTDDGLLPAHIAARFGSPSCLRALHRADPGSLWVDGADRVLPLAIALVTENYGSKLSACWLALHGPQQRVLEALGEFKMSSFMAALYADVIINSPLDAAAWALVPLPCPGLGRALHAVLARSRWEAAQLVAHMEAEDAARLRAYALALNCLQRRRNVPALSSEVQEQLLGLFDSIHAVAAQ